MGSRHEAAEVILRNSPPMTARALAYRLYDLRDYGGDISTPYSNTRKTLRNLERYGIVKADRTVHPALWTISEAD